MPIEWMRDMMGGGMMGMIFGLLLMILLIAAVVVGAVLLMRALWRPGEGQRENPPSRDPALQILEERFARGEIDREEYQERRCTLTA